METWNCSSSARLHSRSEVYPGELRFAGRKRRGAKYRCHRCQTVNFVLGRFPYCTECNWDSLTDACWREDLWAA
jgi:hypothetical protein